MLETGTILQDRYRIEKQIGAGGMGAVYLAVDQRFESFVAIKETFYKDEELGEAFEREAKLLNGLNHPNLPHVSDYFTEGGGHFLVMQFVEGEDLFDILKRGGEFAQADVLRWTNSLLNALDYLHSQEPPVIHRDIKPQNLKITPRGDVILLDFGLAKLNSDDTQAQLSVFGYSRKYSPLEQIQGTGTDARSDIFALGATVYHLLTGKPPIDVLTRASEIVAGKPDPLQLASEINPDIPLPVASVLNTALALNVAARFNSAKAAQNALENALNENSDENAEVAPPLSSVVNASENGADNSVRAENFPALEAFVAESANHPPQTEANDKTAAIKDSNSKQFNSKAEILPKTKFVVEEATRVSPQRQKKSRFSVAALIILLSGIGLAAGYFFTGAGSISESNQMINSESGLSPNANVEQSEKSSEAASTEISDLPNTEKNESIKSARSKSEPIVEKKETIAKQETEEETARQPETTGKSKVAPEKPITARPAARQNPPRNQPPSDGETRSRVVENSPPDIESIFTGRSAGQRGEILRRQEQQRRQRQQMSDEELREYRRQRREERRRRGNNFPF